MHEGERTIYVICIGVCIIMRLEHKIVSILGYDSLCKRHDPVGLLRTVGEIGCHQRSKHLEKNSKETM